MEIKLPENPYLYLILVGTFFMVMTIVIVAVEGETTWEIFLLLSVGVILFVLGWGGLKKDHDLNQRKKQREIELLQMDIFLKKIGKWKP